MKKIILLTMILGVLLLSVCYAVSFSDVAGHWAEQYINDLTNKGVINGYEDGTYRPEGEIKKSEYIKLIMVASLPDYDWDNKECFKYTHWSGKYIQAAEENGIIPFGSINDDNANEVITRGDMVEILGKCDIMLKGNNQETCEIEMYDIANLEPTKLAMLSHCVAKGLIAGYEDYTFRPDKTLTRAEVATILFRFMK